MCAEFARDTRFRDFKVDRARTITEDAESEKNTYRIVDEGFRVANARRSESPFEQHRAIKYARAR